MEIGSPYHMFMMEKEGLLNTRESKLNAVIKELQAYGDAAADLGVQIQCFQNCGLDMNSLTQREIGRIEAALNK